MIALLCMMPLAAAHSRFLQCVESPGLQSAGGHGRKNPAAFGDVISTENNPRLIQFCLKWSF